MTDAYLIYGPRMSGKTFLSNWLKRLEEEKKMKEKEKECAKEIVFRKDGYLLKLKNVDGTYDMVEAVSQSNVVVKFMRGDDSYGTLDLSLACFGTIVTACKAFGIEATRKMALAELTTKELVEELKTRAGVDAKWLENPDSLCLLKEGPGMTLVAAEGPGAQILIITD